MKVKLSKNELPYGYFLYDEKGHLIASTIKGYKKQPLSFKNCQAIERGYDLDELVIDEIPDSSSTTLQVQRTRFIHGFQKALSILGDKKFSEEDVRKAFFHVQNEPTFDVFKKSLQQTEWEVEVEMWFHGTRHKKGEWTPKLDADGCLILRKI